MIIEFYKYQGAGNDFVMLDNFSGKYDDLSMEQIVHLCDRRFGVGADGLIKINKIDSADFEVDYYNADGSKSFCGNGARCSVRFVNETILKRDQYTFLAIDGLHTAQVGGESIHLEMKDVNKVKKINGQTFELQTGSPHYILFSKGIATQNMVEVGKEVRYNEFYKELGINVNLVEELGNNQLSIRTYERGVEDETLSCGTGITAAAIAYAHSNEKTGNQLIHIKAIGGDLSVKLSTENGSQYHAIELIGPAVFVFKGEVNV
jgi:diaminopimelate epimerase